MSKKKKRYLLIFLGNYLAQFLIVEVTGTSVEFLGTKKLRINPYSFSFSEDMFVLEVLENWGKELGIKLTEEMIPIIPQKEKDGLSDIFVFSKRDKGTESITKNNLKFGDEFSREGAKRVLNYTNFKNLVFVSFDFENTTVARYSKADDTTLKVVVESKKYASQKLLEKKEFLELAGKYKQYDDHMITRFLNQLKFPAFNINSLQEVLIEYLQNYLRLEPFVKCKKLKMNEFGKGKKEDNLLIISGEQALVKNNIPVYLLPIMERFNLRGTFGICSDFFGLFDFLQKSKQKVFADEIYTNLLLNYWGTALTIDRKGKKLKLDEEVADVEVVDGESVRQIIPMVGKITNFSFLEKGDIKIDLKKNALIRDSSNKNHVFKKMQGNFVVDARVEPRNANFEKRSEQEVVRSWLSGIGALET